MVEFAGYQMPIQYSGIIDEHLAVRNAAGIFDVSHMGEVLVRGPEAFNFVQALVTNDVAKLDDGKALYTVMCRPDGGIVDDLLVYRLANEEYLLVINASNIDGDITWMHEHNEVGASLTDISNDVALIAIQGPVAFDIARAISPVPVDDLPFYRFTKLEPGSFFGSDFAILSHTGYTGEKGLEIYCDADAAPAVWQALMEAGQAHGLKPAGLGARDTLRLESGFCLYGNDLTLDTNPLEAGLGWLTKLDAGDFVGREALVRVKEQGPKQRLIGFRATERGIPRSGADIQSSTGETIGTVTSGTQSPILSCGIGLGYVRNEADFTAPGTTLQISSRGRSFGVEVTRPPFHRQRTQG